jgi:hypothetical protein
MNQAAGPSGLADAAGRHPSQATTPGLSHGTYLVLLLFYGCARSSGATDRRFSLPATVDARGAPRSARRAQPRRAAGIRAISAATRAGTYGTQVAPRDNRSALTRRASIHSFGPEVMAARCARPGRCLAPCSRSGTVRDPVRHMMRRSGFWRVRVLLPGGCFESDHQLGRDPAAVFDLDALRFGPLADLGGVQPARRGPPPGPR